MTGENRTEPAGNSGTFTGLGLVLRFWERWISCALDTSEPTNRTQTIRSDDIGLLTVQLFNHNSSDIYNIYIIYINKYIIRTVY